MEEMKNTRSPWLLSLSIHRRNGGLLSASYLPCSLQGKQAKDACASGKARRLAPDSSACHHCKACIPILSFNIFLGKCMAGVWDLKLQDGFGRGALGQS